MSQRARAAVVAVTAVIVAASCNREPGSAERPAPASAVTTPSTTAPAPALTTVPPAPSSAVATTAPASTAVVRPDWLGQRPLPQRPDGYGEVQPTPPELLDRRLPTLDELAPPAGDTFASTVSDVPADVLVRSTWHTECPVAASDLRYVTLTFWGFDDRAHTGELLVNADAADGVVEVFRTLLDARFPIEEMRIVRADELDVAPTGDGNNTSAFVCRNAVLSDSWSQHAYGRAIDVNPFHNPYVRGELVLPELASAYADRSDVRPGMVLPGEAVVQAFASIGWEWGGDFSTFRDDMHFSATGH